MKEAGLPSCTRPNRDKNTDLESFLCAWPGATRFTCVHSFNTHDDPRMKVLAQLHFTGEENENKELRALAQGHI